MTTAIDVAKKSLRRAHQRLADFILSGGQDFMEKTRLERKIKRAEKALKQAKPR
jgi:hypothetical protein